jgi:epoxide hydrolase-like predicted phosphatase
MPTKSPAATITKAIIFDFGNVLDHDDQHAEWLTRRDALAAPLKLSGQALWNHIYCGDEWQDVKHGRITNAEFWDRVLSKLGITDRADQEHFVARLFEGHDKVHPDMAALLRELRPHYKLALLSNTFERDMDVWIVTTHGLDGIFDVVVSSARVGLAKPAAAIYHLTLEQLGMAPGEALFIDDQYRNTSAAEALDIPSIVFMSPAQLREALRSRGIVGVAAPKGE